MKLNRTQLVISGILLTVALILSIYFSRQPPSPGAEKGQATSIRELVAQPVNIEKDLEKKNSNVPIACPDLWLRITGSSAEQFVAFSAADREFMKTCSDAVPFLAKHEPGHLEKLRKACTTTDEEGSDAMQSNCALYFYFYKAGLVAWFNQDKRPQQFSTNELALTFFHEYNNLDQARLDRLSKLANELATRSPSYSVLKAKASIELFQFMNQTDQGKADELISTLEELKKQKPEDDQLLEMHFVVLAVLNDQARMNELTENYNKANPSSAVGYYMRSAYFWQTKNREQTIELLKQAIALDPGSSRFMETRDRVESAVPGSNGVYNINVNFDLISE